MALEIRNLLLLLLDLLISFGDLVAEGLVLPLEPLDLRLAVVSTRSGAATHRPPRYPSRRDLHSPGPFLDPLNPQSPYSAVLLDLFRMLLQSPDYRDRLRTHDQMFRASVAREHDRRVLKINTHGRRNRIRFTH